jgi:hypothetical protein
MLERFTKTNRRFYRRYLTINYITYVLNKLNAKLICIILITPALAEEKTQVPGPEP